MDESVQRSMDKFPNTPVVYGWLRLDRRGEWWIRTAHIDHHKIRSFIGRNYSVDERGCHYFQNGAQRVFVALEATPWVYSAAVADDQSIILITHTDCAVMELKAAFLTDDGDLLLETEYGPGLVNDRDLIRVYDLMCDEDGKQLDDDVVAAELESLMETGSADQLFIKYGGKTVKVATIQSVSIADTYGFVETPNKAIS